MRNFFAWVLVCLLFFGAALCSFASGKKDRPVSAGDADTINTFIRAVKDSDIPAVKTHISRTPAIINTKDASGKTGLMYAVENGNQQLIQALLEAGQSVLNPNITDNQGSTALHYAAASRNDNLVTTLLENKLVDTTMINRDGDTAFMIAVKNGSRNMIRAFGGYPGFDVTLPLENGIPPLLIALERSLPPVTIQDILDYCSGAIASRDNRGRGPIEYLDGVSNYRGSDLEDVRDMLTEAENRYKNFR